MGRFLDAAAVAQIADQTQVNFSTALAEQPPGASLQERAGRLPPRLLTGIASTS
ncbi:MAG: hypothetical protein R2875_01010 [Desulfobacterales bacterium]